MLVFLKGGNLREKQFIQMCLGHLCNMAEISDPLGNFFWLLQFPTTPKMFSVSTDSFTWTLSSFDLTANFEHLFQF